MSEVSQSWITIVEERSVQLNKYLEHLANEVQLLARHLGKPLLVPLEEGHYFSIGENSCRSIATLKMIRCVSDLFACNRLVREGHLLQGAVLSRTVREFLDHVLFLIGDDSDDSIVDRREKYVAEFFADEVPMSLPNDWDPKRSESVTTKHVRASLGRQFAKASSIDPYSASRIVNRTQYIRSKYVHGSYRTIMEMYRGGPDCEDEEFTMGPIRSEQKTKIHQVALAYDVRSAFMQAALVAYSWNDKDAGDRLKALHGELESLSAWVSEVST